jgi:hypothetical protein
MKEEAEAYAAEFIETKLPYYRKQPGSCVMEITPDVAEGWLRIAYFAGAEQVIKELQVPKAVTVADIAPGIAAA